MLMETLRLPIGSRSARWRHAAKRRRLFYILFAYSRLSPQRHAGFMRLREYDFHYEGGITRAFAPPPISLAYRRLLTARPPWLFADLQISPGATTFFMPRSCRAFSPLSLLTRSFYIRLYQAATLLIFQSLLFDTGDC